MTSRIRYRPDEDFSNILVSVQTFEVTSSADTKSNLKVHLHLSTNSFELVDQDLEQVVLEGSTTSLHSLKIAAKLALAGLGVSFDKEERKKSNIHPGNLDDSGIKLTDV